MKGFFVFRPLVIEELEQRYRDVEWFLKWIE